MGLLDQILDSLPEPDRPVRSVWCCTFWTMVESLHAGLASSLRGEEGPYHSDEPAEVPDAGNLEGKPIGELAGLLLAQDPVSASIGMATLNSALPIPAAATEQNAAELLARRSRDKNLAVIGHFPFVRRLEDIARKLWVFERRPKPGDLTAEIMDSVLPDCEVVCISGTTLMNHTAEGILRLCRQDAFVVMVGPSTPFSPVLFDYGVDAIAGTVVTDAAAVLRLIRQGATFRQVKAVGVRLLCWAR